MCAWSQTRSLTRCAPPLRPFAHPSSLTLFGPLPPLRSLRSAPSLRPLAHCAPSFTPPLHSQALGDLAATSLAPSASVPAIIFTSRTHSQIAQAVKELKQTSYSPKMVILGSREQLCVHPEVSKERGTRQNYLCQALGKTRSCKFKENVEPYRQAQAGASRAQTQAEARGGCGGGAGGAGERPGAGVSSIMDIEDMLRLGKDEEVCPYFLSRGSKSDQGGGDDVELYFMPYNYVMDPAVRASITVSWHNAAVIFDEAHNIESIASEVASFDLKAGSIAGSIDEVQQCIVIVVYPVHRIDRES